MARPSPVPPYLRVVEASAWVKAWKSMADLFGRDADAGVAHGEVEHVAVSTFTGAIDLADEEEDLALLGEFDGVADEVDEDLLNALEVTHEFARQRRDRCGR
jgi:hypothetical protein